MRAHGLGLGILNSIAEKYQGTLNTQYRDGVFSTFLCLPLPETQKGVCADAK